ncbi:MAG TPA: hypothetical protein VEI57_01045 [Nitrospirota bacterium]|nr:hypothetical protein [Nitrospirota bacterium]
MIGKAPERKKKTLHHDIVHFAGLWSREEAAEFDRNLKAQGKVDLEPWERKKVMLDTSV